MSNHDISVDGDGKNIEDGDTKQTISKERIQLTQLWAPDPVSSKEL